MGETAAEVLAATYTSRDPGFGKGYLLCVKSDYWISINKGRLYCVGLCLLYFAKLL